MKFWRFDMNMRILLFVSLVLSAFSTVSFIKAGRRCCRPRCRSVFVPPCPPLVSFGLYDPYYPPFNPMFFGPPVAPFPYYARPGVAFNFSVGL